MHYSAPAHPLIHALLLQREEFQGVQRLIVETREQGEKLLKILQALEEIQNTKFKRQNGGIVKLDQIEEKRIDYRLITTPTDILEVMYDPDIVGIFPIETLDWSVEDDEKKLSLELTQGMQITQEALLTWLTEHHYSAKKSDEEFSFFRQGDTISIQTRKGVILVSFFGAEIEDIFLGHEKRTEIRLFTKSESKVN